MSAFCSAALDGVFTGPSALASQKSMRLLSFCFLWIVCSRHDRGEYTPQSTTYQHTSGLSTSSPHFTEVYNIHTKNSMDTKKLWENVLAK
jgi:hypothetical protein